VKATSSRRNSPSQSKPKSAGYRRSRGTGGKPYTVIESADPVVSRGKDQEAASPDPAKRFDAIQWRSCSTPAWPESGQLVHFSKFAPKDGNDYANSRYRTE